MQAQIPPVQACLAARELPVDFGWWQACEKLRMEEGFWLLDSALPHAERARFSFAGCDPYWVLRARGEKIDLECRRDVRDGFALGHHGFEADPLSTLRTLLGPALHRLQDSLGEQNPVLESPFLGGAVGYLGYELAGTHEPVELHGRDDLGLPDAVLLFVDQLLVLDHRSERATVLGLGFGDSAELARAAAEKTAESFASRVANCRSQGSAIRIDDESAQAQEDAEPIARDHVLPDVVRSRFDDGGYAKAVGEVLEEIAAGNVYQANFTQRLDIPFEGDPWALYTSLRQISPAPFAAYLQLPDAAILSSSPERFLRLRSDGRVESRPIKGTRPRGRDRGEDDQLRRELASSAKDCAENLMIVDLVRNDLGRVCEVGSIEVPEFQCVEAYRSVFQLVSTVTGRLRPDRDAVDLIRASFPPGSMTGAPKLAAMEILDRLEPCRRGVYSGAIGYIDHRGGLDLSVVIRTLVLQEGLAHLHVGGAVVADSDPRAEYLESLDKAYAPLVALARSDSGGMGR